jgi:hypothetical protein
LKWRVLREPVPVAGGLVGEFTLDYLPDPGSRHGPISRDDFENRDLPGHWHPILEAGRGEEIMRILLCSD